MVQLFNIVGIISGEVLCTDGTLIETFARYRGCNYMEECCTCFDCPNNIINDINKIIEDTVKEIEGEDKSSVIGKITIQCPREEIVKRIIEMVKKKDPEAKLENICRLEIIKFRLIT